MISFLGAIGGAVLGIAVGIYIGFHFSSSKLSKD